MGTINLIFISLEGVFGNCYRNAIIVVVAAAAAADIDVDDIFFRRLFMRDIV